MVLHPHIYIIAWIGDLTGRVERTSYSGKTLDTSLFWQNGIRRNKRAPCVAVWKPVVAATVAAAVLGAVHRRGSAQLPQAVESSCALCHSTGSNSSRTAPSLLGRAGFGTTNAHGWWWSLRMWRLWTGRGWGWWLGRVVVLLISDCDEVKLWCLAIAVCSVNQGIVCLANKIYLCAFTKWWSDISMFSQIYRINCDVIKSVPGLPRSQPCGTMWFSALPHIQTL